MWTIVQILYIEQPTIYVFRQFIFPFLSSFQNAFALTSIAIQGFRPCLPCNWKSDIRSCKPNSTLRHVYRQSIGHNENIWCISKYILNYILKSDIRSCNAPGSPRSGMSIVKVLKTYNDFQCWNQLSGLATHHANPPLTPITCTDPFMSILEIRSCKPFTVLLFRCWNHILGLVDLSLNRWNQVL